MWKTAFFGSGGAIRKDKLERAKTIQAQRLNLQSLTPDELVTTHPGNIEVHYHEVTSVEITRRFFQSQLRFHISRPSTAKQVIRFNLLKKQLPEARRLLKLALPTKTKEK